MVQKTHFFHRCTASGNYWPPVIINSALQSPKQRQAGPPPICSDRIAVCPRGAAVGHECDGINLNSYTLFSASADEFRGRVKALALALNTGTGFREYVVEICDRTEGYVQMMIDQNPTYAFNMNGMGATPQTEARKAAREWGDLVRKYVGKRIYVRRNSPRRGLPTA